MTDSDTESADETAGEDGWLQRLVNAVKWVAQTFEGHAGADDLKNRKR